MKNNYLEYAEAVSDFFSPRVTLTIDNCADMFEERGWTMVGEAGDINSYYIMTLESPDSEVLVRLCVYDNIVIHVAVERRNYGI